MLWPCILTLSLQPWDLTLRMNCEEKDSLLIFLLVLTGLLSAVLAALLLLFCRRKVGFSNQHGQSRQNLKPCLTSVLRWESEGDYQGGGKKRGGDHHRCHPGQSHCWTPGLWIHTFWNMSLESTPHILKCVSQWSSHKIVGSPIRRGWWAWKECRWREDHQVNKFKFEICFLNFLKMVQI